jgi:hypothetical protein
MAVRLAACLLCVAVLTGCSPREVEKDLAITEVHTGWYDVGIVDGYEQARAEHLTQAEERLEGADRARADQRGLQAGRRREGMVRAVRAWHRSDELAPGATGQLLVLRGDRGYTGTETRLQMLQNSQFIDAKVQIFGKHGSRTWVKMGEYQIDRQLLTE